MGWFQKTFCDCPAPEEVVPLSSPARALARSMNSPATRDEWVRTRDYSHFCLTTTYTNELREIQVTKSEYCGLGTGRDERISTPFTLSAAEKRIVRGAIDEFERFQREVREVEILNRLTAPAKKGRKK